MNENNRTVRLSVLVSTADAERIKRAAEAFRMTVSTFLLMAGLDKAAVLLDKPVIEVAK